ncbi:hypothetical protein DFH09DRAFT_1281042 [Mycena vulgaris]|nr:hypothetical protein DFH09DRAFT_1281042 [Mycena vulgaris]
MPLPLAFINISRRVATSFSFDSFTRPLIMRLLSSPFKSTLLYSQPDPPQILGIDTAKFGIPKVAMTALLCPGLYFRGKIHWITKSRETIHNKFSIFLSFSGTRCRCASLAAEGGEGLRAGIRLSYFSVCTALGYRQRPFSTLCATGAEVEAKTVYRGARGSFAYSVDDPEDDPPAPRVTDEKLWVLVICEVLRSRKYCHVIAPGDGLSLEPMAPNEDTTMHNNTLRLKLALARGGGYCRRCILRTRFHTPRTPPISGPTFAAFRTRGRGLRARPPLDAPQHSRGTGTNADDDVAARAGVKGAMHVRERAQNAEHPQRRMRSRRPAGRAPTLDPMTWIAMRLIRGTTALARPRRARSRRPSAGCSYGRAAASVSIRRTVLQDHQHDTARSATEDARQVPAGPSRSEWVSSSPSGAGIPVPLGGIFDARKIEVDGRVQAVKQRARSDELFINSSQPGQTDQCGFVVVISLVWELAELVADSRVPDAAHNLPATSGGEYSNAEIRGARVFDHPDTMPLELLKPDNSNQQPP